MRKLRVDSTATYDDVQYGCLFRSSPKWMTGRDGRSRLRLTRAPGFWKEIYYKDRFIRNW